MQMVVAENVTLTKPLADGKDYAAGDVIELEASVAEDWMRRGWVTVPPPAVPMYVRPRPAGKTEFHRG
jgi:hypothetical protein